MDNKDQNENNRNSEPEQNSSQENIPLWLQGLDDSELEEKGEPSNEKQTEGTWTKELTDTPEMHSKNEREPEKNLPDWLNTLSDVEHETPEPADKQKAEESNSIPSENNSENEIFEDDETTEKVEIKNSSDEDRVESMDEPDNERLDDEGFIEISSMDLSEKPKPDPMAIEEDLSEAEDLPYWLKDMIIERPGDSYPDKAMTYAEIVALSKEDTKPINVYGEKDLSEEEESIEDESSQTEKQIVESEGTAELYESEISEESKPTQEPTEAEIIDVEAEEDALEDDTKPVKPHPETSESGTWESETDQALPIEEETDIGEQTYDEGQVQEETEELIEIDQDQWVQKEEPEQILLTDIETSTDWTEGESENEPEETESEIPHQWPVQESVEQETTLEAPDQWLEEKAEDKKAAPEEPVYWQEIQQTQEETEEEAETGKSFEQEHPQAVKERFHEEETEEVKVKESDHEPETSLKKEEVEQPEDLDQTEPEDIAETKQELPIDQRADDFDDLHDEWEELEQPGGPPKMLRFAKYLLDQGDYDRAKEIFKPFVEKNEFLEDIHDWLIDASDNGAKQHSGTWELIGDIAMAQSHPNRAFEAYKQAITVLLSTKKEFNETD